MQRQSYINQGLVSERTRPTASSQAINEWFFSLPKFVRLRELYVGFTGDSNPLGINQQRMANLRLPPTLEKLSFQIPKSLQLDATDSLLAIIPQCPKLKRIYLPAYLYFDGIRRVNEIWRRHGKTRVDLTILVDTVEIQK